MKETPAIKILLITGVIFLSTSIGFVSSILFFEKDNNKTEIKTVITESSTDDNLNDFRTLQSIYRKVSTETLPVVVLIEAVEISSIESPPNKNPFDYYL